MDSVDRKILTIISASFPLEERPYLHIGQQAGISENEAEQRVSHLRETGIIRRIGATISPRSLGWQSTLCAADIPPERIDDYAALVNAYDEVTHNYERTGHPNCWFTLITPNADRAREIILTLEHGLGVEILNLPASRVFKINVSFDFSSS